MTFNECLKFLGVSHKTLRVWLKNGEIKFTKKLNGRIEIDNDSAAEFRAKKLAERNKK